MEAWIPITIAAAFCQNLRSVLQKQLTGKLSVGGATATRFFFAMPFAIVYVAVGGMSDHAHVLAGLTTSHRLDYFVRDLKADSSAFIRKEFDSKFSWQKGYGVFAVSPSVIEAVRKYIMYQEQHHRGQTFQDEYLDLLIKSETPYDEQYLW